MVWTRISRSRNECQVHKVLDGLQSNPLWDRFWHEGSVDEPQTRCASSVRHIACKFGTAVLQGVIPSRRSIPSLC